MSTRPQRKEPRPTPQETAEEIDFMFSIGQGWGHTMQAVGYTKPASLARCLNRIGCHDIAKVFEEIAREAA